MKPSRSFNSLINKPESEPTDRLSLLKLIQLADSALPIGGAAHSLGLETLIAENLVTAESLPQFLRDYLEETGVLEAIFCRAAYRAASADWAMLNHRLSARKPARESRDASLTLGRRFLQLFQTLEHCDIPAGDAHLAPAFGYAGRILGLAENLITEVYLHQSAMALVSASQRLMPIGQQRASHLIWDLKPAILEAAEASARSAPETAAAFAPLAELASMRHVSLETRLFIS